MEYNFNENYKYNIIENKIKIYSCKNFFFLYLLLFIFIHLYFIEKKKINIKIYRNIYEENKYVKFMKNIKRMKKLVYTVNFGKYDKLKIINRQKGWDYFAFIDSNISDYNNTNWTLIPISDKLNNLNVSDIKKTRYLKLFPHLFFKNYSLSIYIDATYKIIDDLNEFILRILDNKYSIISLEHPDTSSVNTEIDVVISVKKEKQSIGLKVRDKYIKEHFPDNLGLTENSIIIRKHNEKECIELMKEWWKEIENYSHRDQLSFNYVRWKTGIKNKIIPKNFALNYFKQSWHIKFFTIKD